MAIAKMSSKRQVIRVQERCRMARRATPIAFALATLAGCDGTYTKKESSAPLHETAKVDDLIYAPSQHGTGMAVGTTMTGFSDNDGIKFGHSVEITSVDVPNKFAMVFRCEHGKFIVEGQGDRQIDSRSPQTYKDLWAKLSRGDTVELQYFEIYDVKYGPDKDGDGKDDLLERRLVKFDFVDAIPQKPTEQSNNVEK